MLKIIKKIMESRIIRFIMVGGCSTLIDFIIYMLISIWMDISVSKGISMICSSVFSYFANKIFAFSNKEKTNISLLVKFYIVFAANFLVNMGMNRLVYEMTANKIIAFILATICGMSVNYLGQRLIVFVKDN